MKLTPEQLRQNAAAMIAFAEGKPIEFQAEMENGGYMEKWRECDNINRIDSVPHRPKPEPKTRPWMNPEDVPAPICWIRTDAGRMFLVTEISSSGIWTNKVCQHGLDKWAWHEMPDLEYSTDRKQWHKCEVAE